MTKNFLVFSKTLTKLADNALNCADLRFIKARGLKLKQLTLTAVILTLD